MKHFCALLACCCLMAASAPGWAYNSRGARSCSGWQEFRQDKSEGYALNAEIYSTWVVGYLSGIVAGSGTDFLVGTGNESVFVMVDAYCDGNPEMNLADAGTSVARELMRLKKIVHRATLP